MEKQNKKLLSVTVLLICLASMAGIGGGGRGKGVRTAGRKRDGGV